jgi:hypothetical protein
MADTTTPLGERVLQAVGVETHVKKEQSLLVELIQIMLCLIGLIYLVAQLYSLALSWQHRVFCKVVL